MVGIRRPYGGTGSRDPDPRVFIQLINGRYSMANELWSHGLDGLSHDVHPKAQV